MELDLGYYFPIWPQTIGVPIPGTDRKTSLKHALFYGIVAHYCWNGTEKYCYAGTEYLCDLLDLSEQKLSRIRSDLAKLGWVEVVHGDRNKVVRTYACKVSFNQKVKTEGGSFNQKVKTDTSVSPLADNNSLLEKHICASPKPEKLNTLPTDSVGQQAKEIAGGVVKNTTPFGEPVNAPEKKARRRVEYALASELMAIINPAEKDIATVAQNVRSLLTKGYSELDLRRVAKASREDKYYRDKCCAVVLSAKGVADLLAKIDKNDNGGKPKSRLAQIYGA